MFADEENKKKPRALKKITKVRLRNIALYYVERFESSLGNLKTVLKRRVDKYAYQNSEYDKNEAYIWIDELVLEFEKLGYISDERYANFRVRAYIDAGKSERYIQGKLREKGVPSELIVKILDESEYSALDSAILLVKKKKLGAYRLDEEARAEYRQKDMAVLARAGFDYDVILKALEVDDESW